MASSCVARWRLIVAYGSSLKTWVLEDAALSVAMGALTGCNAFRQRRATRCSSTSRAADVRVASTCAIASPVGASSPLPREGFTFVTMPAVSLASDAFFVALRPLASAYRFIGIDSLAAGSGGIDENDARFAYKLQQRLKAIAAETGCVVVVLHHNRKGSGDDVDPREMVRGSSAIFNACDVVLQMTRTKESASFVVRQIKARGGKGVRAVRGAECGGCRDRRERRGVAGGVPEAEAAGDTSKAIGQGQEGHPRPQVAAEHGLASKNQIYHSHQGHPERPNQGAKRARRNRPRRRAQQHVEAHSARWDNDAGTYLVRVGTVYQVRRYSRSRSQCTWRTYRRGVALVLLRPPRKSRACTRYRTSSARRRAAYLPPAQGGIPRPSVRRSHARGSGGGETLLVATPRARALSVALLRLPAFGIPLDGSSKSPEAELPAPPPALDRDLHASSGPDDIENTPARRIEAGDGPSPSLYPHQSSSRARCPTGT